MSIALDAMGGDHAPEAVVAGAVEAAEKLRRRLVLVGDPGRIRRLLPAVSPPNLEVYPASDAVAMDEKPTTAYRRKKDSSLMVAARLVKEGRAEAMVSAGSTGAAATFALLTWRQVPGVHRPAIASKLPNRHGGFVLLDAGASPDADPEHLVEFAIMGRAYAQTILGRPAPRVHLLNIGEEANKGNAFARQAFALLSRYSWFAGNIEGKGMYAEPCDVVVCDAFVGNVVLKTSEGVAEMIADVIRKEVPSSPLVRWAYWPVERATRPLRRQMHYAEAGGAPLLGLNGVCVIAHGRSDARAISNAILTADEAIERRLTDAIRSAFCAETDASPCPAPFASER